MNENRGNITTTTSAMHGIGVHLSGTPKTKKWARLNHQDINLNLPDQMQGIRSSFLGGLVSRAYKFHREVNWVEYAHERQFVDLRENGEHDSYTMKLRGKNNQWTWGSQIWAAWKKSS